MPMATDDARQGATGKKAGATKDDAARAELKELRAQLEELRKRQAEEQQARAAADGEEAARAPAFPALGRQDEPEADEELGVDAPARLRELVGGIEQDLRNARPATLVAVFALGVLVGRLVSR